MAGKETLLKLKVDGSSVEVFVGGGSSDVYYKKSGGSNHSAGLKYNRKSGIFSTFSGSTVKSKDVKSVVIFKILNG